MGKGGLEVVKFVRKDRRWEEANRLGKTLPASEWQKAAEGQSPLFVDKTKTLHDIYTAARARVVFTRPFGFGKSTLLNQLLHLHADPLPFLGSALDHYIETERRRWTIEVKSISFKPSKSRRYLYSFTPLEYRYQHPVLHFTFQHLTAKPADALRRYICDRCSAFSALYRSNIQVLRMDQLSPFLSSIATLDTEKVAVFVDDFDAPLRNRRDAEFADRLKVMQSFGRALHHPDVKLVFCAGETYPPELLSDPSWAAFEDASEREDLSWSCGLTLAELKSVYEHLFPVAAQALNLPQEKLVEALMEWYGNYTFSQNIATRLFDPHSIHCFFRTMKLGSYRPAMEDWARIVAIMRQYPNIHTSPGLYNPLSDLCNAIPSSMNEALGVFFRHRLLTPLRRLESGSYDVQVTNNSCREVLQQAAAFLKGSEGLETCTNAMLAEDLVGLLVAASKLLESAERSQVERLSLEGWAELLCSDQVAIDVNASYVRIQVRGSCLFHIHYLVKEDWKLPPASLHSNPEWTTEKVAYITYCPDLHKLTKAAIATIRLDGVSTSPEFQPVSLA